MSNAVEFPGNNLIIGEDQEEYRDLPAFRDPKDPEGKVVFCYEFNPEELLNVLRTGRVFFMQLTFNHHFQPVSCFSYNPLADREGNQLPESREDKTTDIFNGYISAQIEAHNWENKYNSLLKFAQSKNYDLSEFLDSAPGSGPISDNQNHQSNDEKNSNQ